MCCRFALRPAQFMTAAPIGHRTQGPNVGRAMISEHGLVYVRCGILAAERHPGFHGDFRNGSLSASSGFSVRLWCERRWDFALDGRTDGYAVYKIGAEAPRMRLWRMRMGIISNTRAWEWRQRITQNLVLEVQPTNTP